MAYRFKQRLKYLLDFIAQNIRVALEETSEIVLKVLKFPECQSIASALPEFWFVPFTNV